jgi:hypothetical protein
MSLYEVSAEKNNTVKLHLKVGIVEPEKTYIAMQWLGKRVAAEMNTDSTTEQSIYATLSKQRICKHASTKMGFLLRWLFSVRPVQSSYKGENLEIQLVEC